jgi:hypothetical protein
MWLSKLLCVGCWSCGAAFCRAAHKLEVNSVDDEILEMEYPSPVTHPELVS